MITKLTKCLNLVKLSGQFHNLGKYSQGGILKFLIIYIYIYIYWWKTNYAPQLSKIL